MTTPIPETDIVDSKLAEIEQRIDSRLSAMASSVDKLASTVQLLADRDIRMQERETQQQNFNARIGTQIDKLVQDVGFIQIARAEEKNALQAVQRAYPWLICLSIIGPVLISGLAAAFIKSSMPDPQPRAVVPLYQQQQQQPARIREE